MTPASPAGAPGRGRILGIDYGERRVGLAISDEDQILASPLGVLEHRNRAQLCREIIEAVRRHAVVRIVVGLPLNMKGREGPMALTVREFVARLQVGLEETPIDLFDERFTSREATRVLREAELNARQQRGKLDKVAAQLMLQTWLDRQQPADDEWPGEGAAD